MLIVKINFNVDDRWDHIQRFAHELQLIWRAEPGEPWQLDLSECEYLGPDASALVAVSYLRGKQLGQHPAVKLPVRPEPLVGFCLFVGLVHMVTPHGMRPNQDHPSSETVPLHQFYQAVQNQAIRVTQLVARHVSLSPDMEVYLSACVNEAAQNIEDHAESSIGGVLCGKFFSNRGDVRIAIADSGRGFATSLRNEHGEMSDELAIQRTLEGGYSGKSTPRNMGLGISTLANIVRNHSGELIVYSRKARGIVTPEGVDVRSTPVEFPGSAIFFRMRVGP